MLAPRLEARMLQDLQIQPHEKALEIGTGSGYMAALLGRRAHSVLSLERIPELAVSARAHLQKPVCTRSKYGLRMAPKPWAT